jgi:hypothetical protein
MNTTRKALLIAVSLFLSASAFADPGFTIRVGHDYTVDVKTGANTAVALGEKAHAAINNGGIQAINTNVDIGHDYKVTVKTGANTAVALGKDVSAYINNGGIQSNP